MKATSLVFASLCVALTSSASAETYRIGSLVIENPWSRATPKGSKIAGGYATIRNPGSSPDRLIGGSAEVSKGFEIHTMEMDQGVMRMRQLKDGLEIKPGQTVQLKPGSFHLMFLDLSKPLQKGDRIKGTLVFEKAGTVEINYVVEAIGASGRNEGHGTGHRGH